jgi:hypothetical protein
MMNSYQRRKDEHYYATRPLRDIKRVVGEK